MGQRRVYRQCQRNEAGNHRYALYPARGSLLGINSIKMPEALRNRAWQRLVDDLRPAHLDLIAPRTIDFDDLPDAFDDYLMGSVTGRTVVRIGN